MDVRIVETVLFMGNILVTFSDGKMAICKADEVYKFALTPNVLLNQEDLRIP